MDTILNLISAAGIWSSTALLAWGAALTLEQILCAATQAPEPRPSPFNRGHARAPS